MRIAFVPSDMDAPGCYRCLFPARQLHEQAGHTVRLPKYEKIVRPDGRINFKLDVNLNPPSPMAELWVLQQRFERLWAEGGVHKLREWGIITVADVDDNYLELPEWNPAFYGTHPYRSADGHIVNRSARRSLAKANKWKKAPPNKANREHMHRMFEQVDAMTVTTPYLKELYSKYNSDITVIRNYLDWDIWRDITPQCDVYRWQNRIRIGYSGVWRFRRGDLEILKPVIGPFMRKHPNVDFVAFAPEVHDYLDVPKRQRVLIKEYGFMPQDGGNYPVGRKTATMDISLIPLKPGGMAEAKSHLKGMEANAAGIPFIASDSESYRYWTEPGKNGQIARTPQEWRDALTMWVEDEIARREAGRRGRQKASLHRIQSNYHHWDQVYMRLKGDEYTGIARSAIAHGAVQKVSELANLLRIADERELKTVVEVGSARGGTFWAFSQIAEDDALMISVDIPAGSPLDIRGGVDVYSGRDRERFRTFVKENQTCKLIDANSQMESTLDLLKGVLADRPIDLLMIDADHRYEGVKRDYELYSPLVRDGGLIAFHDVIPQNDKRSGVHLLWNELRSKSRSEQYVGGDNWGLGTWGGIGVLYVGS